MAALTTRREIESAAVEFVVAQEAMAGRFAMDTRGRGMAADVVSGYRVINVKPFSRSSRGSQVRLEPRLVEEAQAQPYTLWLYLVENVGQGDPTLFRLLQVGGADLAAMLAGAVERRYFTLPWPTVLRDRLAAD